MLAFFRSIPSQSMTSFLAEYRMKILIVHAHHDPQSFSSALLNQAAISLRAAGNEVVISDLYSMVFNPVIPPNMLDNQRTCRSRQPSDQTNSNIRHRCQHQMSCEIQKLESADGLIFSFPLWWYGMPAILKGWCDRVLQYAHHSKPQLSANRDRVSHKRGKVIVTTGEDTTAWTGCNSQIKLFEILAPIQKGIFEAHGFHPLKPFVVKAIDEIDDKERQNQLANLDSHLRVFFEDSMLQSYSPA